MSDLSILFMWQIDSSVIAKLSPSLISSFSWGWAGYRFTKPSHPPVHPPSKVWQSANRAILRKQKLLVYMRRPQNSFWTLPLPQNRPNWTKKGQKQPKLKIGAEENLKTKMCLSIWVDPYNFFTSTWCQKIGQVDPKSLKNAIQSGKTETSNYNET